MSLLERNFAKQSLDLAIYFLLLMEREIFIKFLSYHWTQT